MLIVILILKNLLIIYILSKKENSAENLVLLNFVTPLRKKKDLKFCLQFLTTCVQFKMYKYFI